MPFLSGGCTTVPKKLSRDMRQLLTLDALWVINLEKVVSPDSERGLNQEEIIQEGMQLADWGVTPGSAWCHPAVSLLY